MPKTLTYGQISPNFFRCNHGDAVRVLSSVFIIAQSDIRNTEYLISWSQKISLEEPVFE